MSQTLPEPGQQERRRASLSLLLLLLVTTATYLGVVHAGFAWDDGGLVVRNRLTGDLSNIPRFFAMDLWDGSPVEKGVSGYYRPLMLVSLAIDRALYDLSPAGHHLHSLLWHLLAVGACWDLCRRALGWRGATLVATIFALHPVQSEAVVWVSARNDPMAAALGLWALGRVAFVEPRRKAMAGALVFTILAGLAKESVILLPLMLLAVDGALWRRPELRRHGPLLAGIAVVGGMRLLAGVGGATWPESLHWKVLFWRADELLGLVGRLLVLPWPLSTGYALEWLDRLPRGWLLIGWAGLILLGLAVVLGLRRQGRWALIGPAWALIPLVPVVVAVADKALFGERYLYLSMVGIGWILAEIAGRKGLWVAGILALPMAFLVQRRLPDWVDERQLWTAAVEAWPVPYTWAGLGHTYRGAGENEQALSLFIKAIDDPLPDLTVCPQLLGTALALGRPDLAVELGRMARDKGCESGAFMGHYAIALGFVGAWDEVRQVVAESPPDPHRRLDVARAALYKLDGDEQAFGALAATWEGEIPLEEQVDKLLRAAGTVEQAP